LLEIAEYRSPDFRQCLEIRLEPPDKKIRADEETVSVGFEALVGGSIALRVTVSRNPVRALVEDCRYHRTAGAETLGVDGQSAIGRIDDELGSLMIAVIAEEGRQLTEADGSIDAVERASESIPGTLGEPTRIVDRVELLVRQLPGKRTDLSRVGEEGFKKLVE
jgi:hypothetical protein